MIDSMHYVIRGCLMGSGAVFFLFCVVELVMSMTANKPDKKAMTLDDYRKGMDLIERSVCDCDRCKCGCKAQPGFLASGDLERIADHLGHDPYEKDFLTESFSASEGSTVLDAGELKQIHTIVPKQQADGRCVFLDSADRCTIHPVSPYGCRNFKICDDTESPAESGHKIGLALCSIEADTDYRFAWGQLAVYDCFARPIVQRKKELMDHLSKVTRSEMGYDD